MPNLNFSQIKSISLLQRNYSEIADGTKKNGDVVFLKRNTPHVVLLDFDRWQKLMELEQKQGVSVGTKERSVIIGYALQ